MKNLQYFNIAHLRAQMVAFMEAAQVAYAAQHGAYIRSERDADRADQDAYEAILDLRNDFQAMRDAVLDKATDITAKLTVMPQGVALRNLYEKVNAYLLNQSKELAVLIAECDEFLGKSEPTHESDNEAISACLGDDDIETAPEVAMPAIAPAIAPEYIGVALQYVDDVLQDWNWRRHHTSSVMEIDEDTNSCKFTIRSQLAPNLPLDDDFEHDFLLDLHGLLHTHRLCDKYAEPFECVVDGYKVTIRLKDSGRPALQVIDENTFFEMVEAKRIEILTDAIDNRANPRCDYTDQTQVEECVIYDLLNEHKISEEIAEALAMHNFSNPKHPALKVIEGN